MLENEPETSSSSSDEEVDWYDEDDVESDISFDSQSERRHLNRIINFIETINKYDEAEFKEHFRLRRSTAKIILGIEYYLMINNF